MLLIYPGEGSHISGRLNQWLYDRAAGTYEKKWDSAAYQGSSFGDEIEEFARTALLDSRVKRALDLGCGTGRAVRILSTSLPPDTVFSGIDFSSKMLAEFQTWIDQQEPELQKRIIVHERDLADWATDTVTADPFGLIVMLEVGEFVPEFEAVVRKISILIPSGGGLIMTRPAGLWWLAFAHRKQSRMSMRRLLQSVGFERPRFIPWRSRYEFVIARKAAHD